MILTPFFMEVFMDLREARFKKKMTQFDLRIKSGIHQSKISNIERGYVTPREDEKRALAKALGLRETDLKWKEAGQRGH
jgi:transcriptional regulator with XRE-family HTH domain